MQASPAKLDVVTLDLDAIGSGVILQSFGAFETSLFDIQQTLAPFAEANIRLVRSLSQQMTAITEAFKPSTALIQALAEATKPITFPWLIAATPMPHTVPRQTVPRPPASTVSGIAACRVRDNNLITYQGRVLMYTHPGNASGRLFCKFLLAPGHFLSHAEITAETMASDPAKRVGYAMDELKSALRLDRLGYEFRNLRGHGYILERIY